MDKPTGYIIGLLLNIFIIPGSGTLIFGGKAKKTNGIWQIVLAIISYPLIFFIVGIPLYIGVWIWGIVDMAMLIKNS